jgi:hypothetical protein
VARAASLDVSRMSENGLYARQLTLTHQLCNYGFVDLKASDVRAMARQLIEINREIRMRGVQLQLFSESLG